MKYDIGDKVRLREELIPINESSFSPGNTVGMVTDIEIHFDSGYRCRVFWPNGELEWYWGKWLEPVKEL